MTLSSTGGDGDDHARLPDGYPGEAIVTRAADGTVTVERADRLIKVAQEFLDSPDLEPWHIDGDILQLDPAGHYRYRYLRPGRDGELVYERINES